MALSQARNMRNDLVHDGIVPDLKVIEDLWNTIPELVEVASGIQQLGLRKLLAVGTSNWTMPTKINFDEWEQLAKACQP